MATKPSTTRRSSAAGFNLSLYNPTVRAVLYQVLVVGVVGFVIWYLTTTTMANLESRKIATGFEFLTREAGLPISETPIDYSPADTYARALLIGILNTLRVAIAGIILATILGTIIGIARLSTNWLVARTARVYVEVIRNLPLALQLLFWWTLFRDLFPGPRDALSPLPGVFVSNRGITIPRFVWSETDIYVLLAAVVGVVASIVLRSWARRRQMLTGQQFPTLWATLGLVIGLPAFMYVLLGAPLTLEIPKPGRFNLTGGITLTPEFAALLIGLVTYTAAFIAEIVRSGILAVSRGQWEAASALGLRPGHVLRLVVLPQALRVIVPPLTSQYLNLTKNSSLAVIIGYQDIVSIANTILNQTGQAIEGIAIIMAVFLTISLSISAFMNWYNRRIALVER